jgi:hypothetical protein
MKLKHIITAIVALIAAGNLLYSQPATIPWSVTDGGGGKSSGGGFTLSSSIGQPGSGTMTGTGFIIEGGFLSGLRQLSGTTSTLDVQLASAWNLLSVPFISADMSKTALFPTATSNAFAYGPTGYVSKDTLSNGVGYWLKFATSQTQSFTGTSFAPETIDVSTGWNMIGTVSYPALTSTIVALPSASVVSPYFGYSVSGYGAEDTLKPGLGYWVKISGNGKLVIQAAPAIPPQVSSSIASVKKGHESDKYGSSVANVLEGFYALHVKDAREQERTVYFAGQQKSVNLGQFELPPVPPGEVLDVRFRSQRTVEMPDADGLSEFPLQISNAAFPLTFNWDLNGDNRGAYTLEVRTEKGTKQYPIRGTGNLVVADEGFVSAKIRLIAQQEVQLPKVFALYQNYPNPFNPTTTIKYDVPRTSKVSLKLYDLLGQEVRTLVSEERAAGRYAVDLNANDLPSGVYYFRLLAGDFSDVKRLLLMK